jgi:protein ImuB
MKQRKSVPAKGLPFVLVEAGTRGLRVVAANLAARNFGVEVSQRLADARAREPDLLSEMHEPDLDASSLLGLCRWMERYSPWVAPDAPDGLLLDITGVPHLFGGEEAMLAEVTSRLQHYGFTSRIAAGATIGAAWGLARYARKPDEVSSLPVEALRIGPEPSTILRRLGLKTVGSLMAIPRASLARRFRGERVHENVLTRLDEFLGVRDEPLNALNPPPTFTAHKALMEPLISTEGLEHLLTGLVFQLCRDLEKQNQGALRLVLKLYRTDGSRSVVPAGLSSPSHDADHIFRLFKPRMETVDAGFGIDAMTLEARETATVHAQQYGFMEDTSLADFDRLNDRVMNRHDSALESLVPVESYIPERAEKKSATRPKPSPQAMKHRPLLILQSAEVAAVIASVPDGPPMRFTWRKVTRRVLKSQGPERIAPEWWQLGEVGTQPRDYYVIEDEQGRRYWIYREGLYGETGEAQPKWFVHGLSA